MDQNLTWVSKPPEFFTVTGLNVVTLDFKFYRVAIHFQA